MMGTFAFPKSLADCVLGNLVPLCEPSLNLHLQRAGEWICFSLTVSRHLSLGTYPLVCISAF